MSTPQDVSGLVSAMTNRVSRQMLGGQPVSMTSTAISAMLILRRAAKNSGVTGVADSSDIPSLQESGRNEAGIPLYRPLRTR